MKYIFKLFLPLIILNTLFGNSYNEALIIVSQIVGILLIALCFFILHYFIRYKYSLFLLILLIISKVISLLSELRIFYDIAYSFLFIITGAYIFNKYVNIVKDQFILYFVIAGLVLFFQISGWFPQLHLFNIYAKEYLENYGSIHGGVINFSNVIFSYGDRYSLFDVDQIYSSNVQFRPSGIFHSNAFLGPFMLVAYYFIITWYKKYNKNVLFFFLTFFLLITGSKLVLFCSFLCLLFSKKYLENTYNKTLIIYSLSFIFYYMVFPIVFLTNFTFDAIIYSFGIRLIDQLSIFGNYEYLFSYDVINSYSKLDNDYQGFSGFFSYIFILIFLAFVYFVFKKNFKQYFKSQMIDQEQKFLYKCIFIWLAFVFFSTPLFGNHLISFIIGFLFTPLISKSYFSKNSLYLIFNRSNPSLSAK